MEKPNNKIVQSAISNILVGNHTGATHFLKSGRHLTTQLMVGLSGYDAENSASRHCATRMQQTAARAQICVCCTTMPEGTPRLLSVLVLHIVLATNLCQLLVRCGRLQPCSSPDLHGIHSILSQPCME